jgi:hypothetical protein
MKGRATSPRTNTVQSRLVSAEDQRYREAFDALTEAALRKQRPASASKHLDTLEDPRRNDWSIGHTPGGILAIALCAVIGGAGKTSKRSARQAKAIPKATRTHWGIEDKVRWVGCWT